MIKSLKALIKGHFTVFKHLFKSAVTLEYPEKSPNLPERFRGKHVLKNCIACGTCVKVCPANAISIEKDGKVLRSFKIDMKKCIFCGNCQYHCPVAAIKHGESFELATAEKEDLICELYNQEEDLR